MMFQSMLNREKVIVIISYDAEANVKKKVIKLIPVPTATKLIFPE